MFFVGLIVLGIYADVPDPPLTEPFKNKEFYGVWEASSTSVLAAGKMTITQTGISFEKNDSYEECPYLLYNGKQDVILKCLVKYPYGETKYELIRLAIKKPRYLDKGVSLSVSYCDTYAGAFFGISYQPDMLYSKCFEGYYYRPTSTTSKPFSK